MKKFFLIFFFLLPVCLLHAQNWDYIRSSGEYYYGVGHGKTEAEASEMALSELVNMIAVNVTNEFIGLTDETAVNGDLDHQVKVLNCVKTYSQSTLTNVQKWPIGEEPNITIRCYMKCSEMQRVFDDRIAKAKDMILIAEEAKEVGKVDMALQYYYWAYTLIRSLQHPNEVKNDEGKVLMNWLPLKIDEVLSKIQVSVVKREGNFVDLKFTYDGKDVSSLEYTYSDGRVECQGAAKDGLGVLEMAPGYDKAFFHINVEYQYKGQARGDAEMHSVLNVVPRKMFKHADFVLKNVAKTSNASSKGMAYEPAPKASEQVKEEQHAVNNLEMYAEKLDRVLNAIQTKNYSDVTGLLTVTGQDVYNKLISYGKGRIVGKPDFLFSQGPNGSVVVRGLQMSFSFGGGKKKTFVEDVVFTFNKEARIDNIAFGLGKQSTDNILLKKASGWTREVREMLIEFLENYKTAYCLKRADYIESIFADDAVIIIGNVAQRAGTNSRNYDGMQLSVSGQDKITYNRMKKDTYLSRLRACFRKNEFINIRFSSNDIQRLEKFTEKDLYAIQIGQEYNSSSYSDKGYLFLMVDMTDRNTPMIKIRTWQPDEVSMSKLYNAGDFYNN